MGLRIKNPLHCSIARTMQGTYYNLLRGSTLVALPIADAMLFILPYAEPLH